jgi:ABC-2 type transport system ATP-binding protein
MNESLSDNQPGPLIEFRGVSKWYGPVIAVNDATMQLTPGITGLVGPNGAGKSTLIKLMTGQLRPSIGQVRVGGLRAWSARAKSRIGYCPDVDAFYEELSGRSFVRMLARLHGFRRRQAKQRTEEVLDRVGMAQRANRPLGAYSKGMRQRIKLAQALVHDPELLVLDEPLNGVDPTGRLEMADLFRQLAGQGKTILISSHVLEDMDKLADRVFFINHGHIVAAGSLPEIRKLMEDHPLKVLIGAAAPRQLAARLVASELVRAVELVDGNALLVQVHRPKDFFAFLTDLVMEENHEVRRLHISDASTQAVFDYLMRS